MQTIIMVHIGAALLAVLLGAVILGYRRWPKGSRSHRIAGRTWATLMVVTAVSAFWIRHSATSRWSALHLLSILVLLSLARAIVAARRGRLSAHRNALIGTYAGLVMAGVAAVAVPGRLLETILWH